jgi:hypothetical protein
MSHSYRLALLPMATFALALSGCAMMDGSSTTTAQSSGAGAMGNTSSAYMPASLGPFSLSNCMKYEATPKECEAVVLRGE